MREVSDFPHPGHGAQENEIKSKSGYYLLYLQQLKELVMAASWQPQCPTSAQAVPDTVPVTVPDNICCRELQFGF